MEEFFENKEMLTKFIEWLWEFIRKNLEPKKNDSILNRVKKRNEK